MKKYTLAICAVGLLVLFVCFMAIINCNNSSKQVPTETAAVQYKNLNLSQKSAVMVEVYSMNCDPFTCRLGIKVSNLTSENVELNVKCMYEDGILFNEKKIEVKKLNDKKFLMIGLSRPYMKIEIGCNAE